MPIPRIISSEVPAVPVAISVRTPTQGKIIDTKKKTIPPINPPMGAKKILHAILPKRPPPI